VCLGLKVNFVVMRTAYVLCNLFINSIVCLHFFFSSGRVRKNYIIMVFMNILYSHIVLCSLSKEVTGCIKLM